MDGLRFDAPMRRLGRQASRRGLFGAMAAAGVSFAASAAPGFAKFHGDGASARKQGKTRRGGVSPQGPRGDGSGKANRCMHDHQCCTGFCHKKKCRCRKCDGRLRRSSIVHANTAGDPPAASNCIDGAGGTGCGICAAMAAQRTDGTKASRKLRAGGR